MRLLWSMQFLVAAMTGWSLVEGLNDCLDEQSSDYRCGEVSTSSVMSLQSCDLVDEDIPDVDACLDNAGRGNITTVYLSNNFFTTLPEGLFRDLPALTYLRLWQNPFTSLPERLLEGLSALQSLDLWGCSELMTLPEGFFQELPALERMRLDRNAFTELPEGLFQGLTALEYVQLHLNALTTLPEGLFNGLTALDELWLGENSLSELPQGVFQGLTALESLHVDGNGLATLPEGVFRSLTTLTRLWLDNNSFTELPEGVFQDLTGLEKLYLDDNPMTMLPEGLFTGLTALDHLDLQRNALIALPEGIFADQAALSSLYLDGNELTTLPEGVFEGLTGLDRLDLHDNDDLQCVPSNSATAVTTSNGAEVGVCGCEPAAAVMCDDGIDCKPGASVENPGYTCGVTTCSNGVPGVESQEGFVCCVAECGACGGAGCSSFGATYDLDANDCCVGKILDNGQSCSTTGAAPCVINEVDGDDDDDEGDDDDSATTCSNGVPGVESQEGFVCCVAECGACGGVGCSSFGATYGLDANDCCVGKILDNGQSCSTTGVAPCAIDRAR